MKKKFTFLIAALMLLMMIGLPWKVVGQSSTYTKVTTAPSDWSGTYVIVADQSSVIFTGQSGNNTYGGYTPVTISDGSVTGDYSNYEVTVAKSGDYYTIKHGTKFLGLTSNNNNLNFNTTGGDNYKWTLSVSAIVPKNYTSRKIQYNSNNNSQRFACYGGTQKDAFLYKKQSVPATCTPSSNSIAFGEVAAGNSSSQNITLTTANVSGNMSLTITGTNASMFSITQPNPATISQNTTTTVTIAYSPTTVGAHTATLTISGGGLSSNVTVTLTGTGLCNAPAYALAYDDVSLPLVNGEAETTLEPKTGTGNGGTAFTYEITNGNEEHAMVDNDGTFWADAAGTWEVTATQALNGTTCGGSATINIVVTSSPICTISPTSYAFGNVLTSSENECIFTVNTANLTHGLTVSVESDASGFSVSPTSIAANSLSPTHVTVTYTAPASAGSQVSATLRISGDDFDDDITATITATPTAGYTITFHGGSGTPAILSVTNLSGHVFQLPSATPSAMCSDAGWTFTGWNVNEPVSATYTEPAGLLTAGSNYTISGDAELYAVYSVIEGGASNSGNVFESGSYNNGSITWTLAGVVTILQEQNGAQTAPNSSYVNAPRWYSGNKITITPSQTINSITVTASSVSYATALANSTYTNASASASDEVVTITPSNGNSEITIVMGGQSRLSSLTVNYGSGTTTYATSPNCTPQVATPTFSPVAGFYSTTQNVTINCETSTPRTIYYTTDGSTPTTNSSEYSSAISVSETTTIKAIAVKTNYDNSEVAEATFVINNADHPYTVVQARAAIDANFALSDVYVYGIVSTAGTVSNGEITYSISDDGTTTTELQAYRGKSFNGDDFESDFDIQRGDKVIIRGTLKKFGTTYEFDAGNTLISLERDPIITVSAESISGLSCIVGTGVAPYQAAAGEAMTFTVGGANLQSNITLKLSSGTDFEMKSGNGSWQTTPITLTKDEDDNVATTTISVRLKANATTIGEKTATIAIESTNAPSKNVALTGNVNYATLVYNANGGTGDAPTGGSSYYYNQQITVADKGSLVYTGHTFAGWNTQNDGEGETYAAGSTLNIIANTTLYAQWAVNTHNITMPASDAYGTYTATATTDVEYGTSITLTYDMASGVSGKIALWSSNDVEITNNGTTASFTMPDKDVVIMVQVIDDPCVTDVVNLALTGVTSTSYTSWENKTCTNTGHSNAVYAGVTTTNSNDNLQMNNGNNNRGIVSTSSGGRLTKVSISWYSSPGERTITVYGKTTAYESASDLYDNNKRGTAIGTLTGSSTTLEVSGNYTHVGFYASGAIYINEIDIDWLPTTTYNVTYYGNATTTGSTTDEGTYQTLAQVTVQENGYTHNSGYTFNSWNTKADGSGTTYIPGAKFTMGAANVKLYAQWNHNIPVNGNNELESDFIVNSGEVATISNITIIPSDVTLTVNGTLINTNSANLVVKDGGQLICNNSAAVTVEKNISSWGSKGVGGWNFIASPIAGSIDPKGAGLITDETGAGEGEHTYDLYSLDVTYTNEEWRNYRKHGFDLDNGMGYLYANVGTPTLNFIGNIQPSNVNKDVTGLVAGNFNLVGNPYTCDAYLNQPYFTINDADTEGGITNSTEATLSSVKIPSCTGVIVKTDAETTSVTFSKTAPDASANNGNLQMVLAQNVATRGERTAQTLDKAIVSFNEGSQLGKFYFGTQDANLYIPQDNEEYAIVSSSAQGEMPVNFKAHRDGQYTITVNPEEVEMGYLHLIDNIGGMDVDLLATPSYTFNAKADDYESRFRLVFVANANEDESQNDFAFISNGSLIVTGEGTLQIFDILGHQLFTKQAPLTSQLSTLTFKAGVYVLRLINGENVKTQKIIVK